MAQVYPSDWQHMTQEGLLARELDILQQLASGLPLSYRVYHGVHWTRLEHNLTVTGRLQFLVVLPSGMLVLVAMRTGVVRVESGRLLKKNAQGETDILEDALHQGHQLSRQFFDQHQKTLRFEPVLLFPDFKVAALDGVGLQARRVVDATGQPGLCALIESIEEAAVASRTTCPSPDELHRFLTNTLQLMPEVGVLSLASEQWMTRLAHGLEDWVSRLHFEPFRLRVRGTAGSGKSQLALREMMNNQVRKARTLYVCYNRPLAAHMQTVVQQAGHQGCAIFNFHALCDRVLRDAGQVPDFTQAHAFDRMVQAALNLPVDKRWVFDSVVVDEGQDFEPAWLAVLQRFAHAGTRWLWLEDPAQNLYEKQVIPLPGWVELSVQLNFRNPQRVVECINRLVHEFDTLDAKVFAMRAMSPIEGFEVQCLAYESQNGPLDATAKAITQCLKMGFSREQIAVLTLRGHEKSKVLKSPKAGPHALSHFTGHYDAHGIPEYTAGAVLAESVYRFKGQAASAIILTEIELEQWDDKAFRKLFVGMSRSKMALFLVGDHATMTRISTPLGLPLTGLG